MDMDKNDIRKELPKLVITDIDGVWTDGGMYYTADGDVMKKFSVRDGWGVSMLRRHGIDTVIMTGENSEVVMQRARKLSIDQCHIGVRDKLGLAKSICEERRISLQDVAFIGDDINDLPLLRAVGLSATPADASDYIQREVDYVTQTRGGQGAFREFVEKILSDGGLLHATVEALLPL
ncbi:MAG: HAD-IIIA family hydrolase [Proteiniphilum sp.]|nr:HAD-IIIA family hydrolase [Proteiniphilum sp.]MEA5129295.1 HAD-IIIA family hydrolase [Proteiniphilum sp.]OJV84909.1 MAG: acylneuraminate cytidylyltransferase [Bacteroidia bacterium 44-10]